MLPVTRFTIVFCLILVLITPNVSVYALTGQGGNKDEIETLNQKKKEKEDKIKQIEQTIESYKKQIAQKQLEASSLSNQLSILDNRLAEVELDIEATQEKLDALTFEIDALGLSIEDKQKTVEKQQAMIAEFIRTIHYSDDKEYIEVAAAYDSFSEFYNQVQYLKTVETDLGNSAKALKIAKADLEDKQLKAEERKVVYHKLQTQLTEKRKDLDEQSKYKEVLLVQTKSSELTYKTLVTSLKSTHQQIQNEISGIEREVRQKLASTEKLQQLEGGGEIVLSWPTQSRYVTAYFYDPSYPYRSVFEHNAIDIRSAQGTPVKAAASGYVARARHCDTASCYAYVMIVHANGISTIYGHLSGMTVEEDQFVARGDLVGYSGAMPGTVGAGPFTTGPHLHFEVRKDGIPVNPLAYLVKDY